MEERTEQTRVRIGFKPNAKGMIGIDVTAESTSIDSVKTILEKGINIFREIADKEGFKIIEGGE